MRLEAFDALVLDMDGVIVDSEDRWKDAERPFFRQIVPAWREQDFERIVGLGVADLHAHLTRHYGLRWPLGRFLRRCDELAEEVYGRRVRLAVDLHPLFGRLRALRMPVALASSSPRAWIRKVLDRFGLHPHFKAVVSVDDLGGEGKPSPAIYRRATGLLGVPPSRCLAVEDSRYGVLAAKRAGLSCAGLRNGGNAEQDLSLSDAEIGGLAELLR